MKEKELKKSNTKGITLIALIITIIVMLILVGVTISIAINGGLFANVKQAKTDTQNALNAENKLSEGKVNIDGKIYNSIDEYVGGATSKYIGPLGEALNVDDYGKIVTNFKSEGYPDLVWRVFFENKENVYLISETADGDYPEQDYVFLGLEDYYESGADVSKEGQELMPLAKEAGLFEEKNKNNNILVTAYLCDTEDYTDYLDKDGKAVWAMLGPTIELFVASYNATQNKEVTLTVNSVGYDNAGLINDNVFTVNMNNGIYRLKNSDQNYWFLASPSGKDDLGRVYSCVNDATGCLNDVKKTDNKNCRPIVCIPQSNFVGFTLE